jgi:hypothetical protein
LDSDNSKVDLTWKEGVVCKYDKDAWQDRWEKKLYAFSSIPHSLVGCQTKENKYGVFESLSYT